MKKYLLFLCFALPILTTQAQETRIDGRIQLLLEEFFEHCKTYEIPFHDKLFQLKRVGVVEDLRTSPTGMVLGMLQRNEEGVVENIAINFIAMLDPEVFKIVSFHEFAHYFLEYEKHVCEDCGMIMARVNSSYFDIARDWDVQLKKLFEESPAYKNIQNAKATETLVPEG